MKFLKYCLATDQLFNPYFINSGDGTSIGFKNPCVTNSKTDNTDDEPYVVYYSFSSNCNAVMEVLDPLDRYHYYLLEIK